VTDRDRRLLIRRMKGLPDGVGVRLPIRDDEMEVIGYLKVFDRLNLDDGSLIETMAAARTRYREFFLTQFDVTPENKREWLENSVLNNDSKMLFLVETLDGRVVGQDGFTLLEDGCFALDGTMRWMRGGCPEIFLRNSFERAAIGFFLFGCETLKVEIFGKNKMAIDNTLLLGLVVKAEHPLVRSETDGAVTFRVVSHMSHVNTPETLVEFSLEKSSFALLNGALVDSPCWKGIISLDARGNEDKSAFP
jgi:hypothetical protein